MPSNAACLDGAAARIERYAQGAVGEAEWAETWDCALNSLALFRRYVQPSRADGYTPDDLRAFANRFLIRAVPVTPEAIAASFAIKSALLGGSEDVLRPEEFDRLQGFLASARAVSLNLLPHLAARARAPSPSSLLALSDAFARAGAALGGALDTRANPSLRLRSLEQLAQELARGGGFRLPEGFGEQLRAAKLALLAGDGALVEPGAWPVVFRLLGEYSGGLVAALTATRDRELSRASEQDWAAFWSGWVERLRAPVDLTLGRHRGALPLLAIDGIIDSIPESRWRQWAGVPEGRRFERAMIKRALRPIAQRVLGSRAREAIDQAAVRRTFDRWQSWQRGDAWLERIFAAEALDPADATREEFRRAAHAQADRLGAGDPGKRDIARLIALSESYQTLYRAGDAQLTYGLGALQTLDHLRKLHALELVAQILLEGYGSEDGMATLADLRALVGDFKELGFALAFLDASIPQVEEKRFREIDLFMLSSNGDGMADAREVTYYLMTFLSTRELSTRVRARAESGCGSGGERDPLGWPWLAPECFRARYFEARSEFWDHFPRLQAYYEQADRKARAKLERSLETAARDGIDLTAPIASMDTVGFAGLVHYVEGLLARFDANGDGAIDLAESREAFPVYRRALSELSVIPFHDKSTLEAIFTYVLKRAHPPEKNILGVAKFLWWRAQKPFWRFRCDRGCLYSVFSSFKVPPKAVSEAIPPSAAGN